MNADTYKPKESRFDRLSLAEQTMINEAISTLITDELSQLMRSFQMHIQARYPSLSADQLQEHLQAFGLRMHSELMKKYNTEEMRNALADQLPKDASDAISAQKIQRARAAVLLQEDPMSSEGLILQATSESIAPELSQKLYDDFVSDWMNSWADHERGRSDMVSARRSVLIARSDRGVDWLSDVEAEAWLEACENKEVMIQGDGRKDSKTLQAWVLSYRYNSVQEKSMDDNTQREWIEYAHTLKNVLTEEVLASWLKIHRIKSSVRNFFLNGKKAA